MRAMKFFAAILVGMGLWAGGAKAAVQIQVDLSSQTMHVTNGSGQSFNWPVSTARFGYSTPRGTYGVQSLQAMHYSHKYHNSPMPHSIFFHGGYAIHGTYDIAALGRAASHGCVRLSPAHAAELFSMVRAEGANISIVGSAPQSQIRYAKAGGGSRVKVAARAGRVRVAAHRYRDRAYYARRAAEQNPLAYAPTPEPAAPSYGSWIQNPFGW